MTTFVPLDVSWIENQDVTDLTMAQNAVTSVGIDAVALNRQSIMSINPTTEYCWDELPVTNQKRSGRCWAFAALNVFRHDLARRLHVEDFEFSVAFLQYYDKLEKARHTLSLLETADERQRDYLYHHGFSDGGWWNYAVNLIEKYGIVPASAMPESESSSNTAELDRALGRVIRRGGSLGDAHRIIATHVGIPPRHFRFIYRDKDKVFHDEGDMTPRDFAQRYLGSLQNYLMVGHDPRYPLNTVIQVQDSTNVLGTDPLCFWNVSIEDMLNLAIETLQDGHSVWFSCDVNAQFSRKQGLWDSNLFTYDAVYGIDSSTSRRERFESFDSIATHAMVLTGVDKDRFRVENSWGSTIDQKTPLKDAGYGTMTFTWFKNYAHSIVLDSTRVTLPENPQVVTVPFWDQWA